MRRLLPDWHLDTGRARLILASAGLAAVTLAAGCSGMIARSPTPRGVAAGEQRDVEQAAVATTVTATTAAPTTAATTTTRAPTTAAPTTAATTTTQAPTTTRAPTTTEPSPAIVPVARPEAPFVAVGSNSGGETARIQQRLLELGFWNSGADGDYGLTTTHAVMAFQKYLGLEASGYVNQETADALTNLEFRAHGLADAGTLVEIDKGKQLLFIVHDGRTVWVYNTSTGDGQPYEEADQNTPGEVQTGVSITRSGLHEVYRERPVGWWEGDLGQIYRPKYFSGGQAVHGSNNVPNYPASHGCVRVSIQAMDFIWDNNLMPLHIPVWVHGPDTP